MSYNAKIWEQHLENSKIMATDGAWVEEGLRQVKLEGHGMNEQLQKTKKLLEIAGNLQEACWDAK